MNSQVGAAPFAGALAQDVLDALPVEIVIVDQRGDIVAVNAAWRRFARDNGWREGVRPEGLSYLAACESGDGKGADEGALFRTSLRALLDGRRREYAMEYPCHSPDERRWFQARASRLERGGQVFAVITHEDITARRLAEERQRHVAQTLQASLLPRRLPELPWLRVAARFLPAAQGLEVGGDFYDVVAGDDGTAMAMVGDVCGKGAEAAAVAGYARHTLCALSHAAPDPGALLRELDHALRREHGEGSLYLTAACAALRRDGDGVEATVALGGHPPAMLVRADGTVTMLGRPGSLLGWSADVRVQPVDVRLDPGDALVLYTDGVTEARGANGEVFGETRLRALGAGLAGASPEALAEAVRRAGLVHSGGRNRDDLAVLALSVPHRA